MFFGDTSCLSRSVRTTCDNEHLTIISEWRKKKRKASPLRNVLKGVIVAS